MTPLSSRERRHERDARAQAERKAKLDEQIARGSLVIRQATPEERRWYGMPNQPRGTDDH